MNLSKDDDGLPIVPGAADVSEELPGVYIAYGDPVPNPNGKGSRRGAAQVQAYLTEHDTGEYDQVQAYLTEHDTGEYVVVAEENEFSVIDPEDEGVRPQDVYRFYSIDGTQPDPKGGDPISFSGLKHAFSKGNIPALPPTAQVPWVIGDMTVTNMRPSLPAAFNQEQYDAVENEAI
jgi:hypothetical protein